jgi:ketosteroid isomerase-like protein
MTPDRIREIFKPLEAGDGAAFFAHVADDVDWTVMGTHPLAGQYHSKAAYAGTFTKLGKVAPWIRTLCGAGRRFGRRRLH